MNWRRTGFLLVAGLGFCLGLGHSAGASGASLNAEIEVRGVTGKTISGNIIGANLHVGYERDIDTAPKKNQIIKLGADKQISLTADVINRCREASIRILRFPGGCTSDAYHWRDGVGSIKNRTIGKDEYGRPLKNFFGTTELARVARAVGAEMLITANYKSGTAQEAANWVEFCNAGAPDMQPCWLEDSFVASASAPPGYFAWLRAQYGQAEPLHVKYWEIGNEIYFHKDKDYIGRAVEFSRLMKAKDPSIQVGLSCDSFPYMSDDSIRKTDIPRSAFDFIVLHYYGSLSTKLPITNFYSNGESTRTFNLDKSGAYEILVEAKGEKALEWPNMPLLVNGALIRQFNVASPSLSTYSATAEMREGQNTLTLKFTNDRVIPGVGDCNLFVKSVKIVGPDRKPVEVWNTSEYEYAWLFANNRLIEEHMKKIRQIFADTPLMVTEGNTGYGINKDGVDSEESRKLKAGLWMAGLLNALIRNDVPVFNQWELLGSHLGFALILTDGHVTPSYYVMKMYSVHAGRRLVELGITSTTFDAPLLSTTAFGKATTGNPFVDAVASYNESSGELAVTAVNRHARSPVSTRIALGKLKLTSSEVTVETLNSADGDGLEASNEKNPNNVMTKSKRFKAGDEIAVDLEPHSLTTIRCTVRP